MDSYKSAWNQSCSSREVQSWYPDDFPVLSLSSPVDLSHHRWTVDVPADYEFDHRVYDSLNPDGNGRIFGYLDVLPLFEKQPDWPSLNREDEQAVEIIAPEPEDFRY